MRVYRDVRVVDHHFFATVGAVVKYADDAEDLPVALGCEIDVRKTPGECKRAASSRRGFRRFFRLAERCEKRLLRDVIIS